MKLHQRERERFKDAGLRDRNDVITSQGISAAARNCKSQVDIGSPPRSLPRLCSPVVTLIFGPVKLITDFWPPDL